MTLCVISFLVSVCLQGGHLIEKEQFDSVVLSLAFCYFYCNYVICNLNHVVENVLYWKCTKLISCTDTVHAFLLRYLPEIYSY